MLTRMTEDDWSLVLQVFNACRTRQGDRGHDDRKFLEALHYFTLHNIMWRALPAEFGPWNTRVEALLAIEPKRRPDGVL